MRNAENEKIREIINYAASKNMIVAQDAIAVLQNEEYKEIIDFFEASGKSFISEKDAREQVLKSRTKIGSVVSEVSVEKSSPRMEAKEVDSDLRIIKEYDITDKSTSEGRVENFLELFRDKFEFLSSLLAKRGTLKLKKIGQLKSLKRNEKIEIVGMVSEKWVTKNGNLAFRLEDTDDECIAIAKRDNSQKAREVEKIINDDVIAVKGTKISEGLITLEEFFWPDLEQGSPKEANRNLNIALISDVHAGSRLFMEKEFARMIKWLSGGEQLTNEREREELGKIKYLVIAGDNIDGIGVYPDQIEELAIKDIYEQYDKFSEYISSIPEHIEIIICPGQHDAVRRADPQPAIPKEFLPELSKMKNIHLVGSPSWFEVEGLKAIVYHGASLHDMYMSVKNLNPREPEKAIIEVLKRRDLMVSYGLNQPYIPERKDYLLIREKPDLYFGADMHHNGFAHYRGCTIMNGSTWQLQTEFQKEQGHIPTPGIFMMLSLKGRKLMEKKFIGADKIA